jgi:DNA-binding transcriptional MocR family regulator
VSGARQPRLTWRSAALEPDSGLSWRARFAAAVYCEFANGQGALDPAPSVATMATRMGVAERTVREARRELEEAGWLDVQRRPGRPSRMVLLTGEPRQEVPGSEGATPAPSTARSTARSTAPPTPEPENQKTRRPDPPKPPRKRGGEKEKKDLETALLPRGGQSRGKSGRRRPRRVAPADVDELAASMPWEEEKT